ncbi:hypothetical protein E3N88_42212 [Mikania micrantha]|uniref:Uncharacterized protein n=1 Tax=Mikania micrantha TaxID=192012 RepID=A0A5N6LIE1_9ASTR|nr:hypothetical protein E3N88_42212 [Mikania micrantha]
MGNGLNHKWCDLLMMNLWSIGVLGEKGEQRGYVFGKSFDMAMFPGTRPCHICTSEFWKLSDMAMFLRNTPMLLLYV